MNKIGNATPQPQRILWVDLLRAMAIIFVVLVHAAYKYNGWWIYNVFIGPIMLPLFFAISGYLFNDRKGNSKIFYLNLFKKLLIPWFFLSLIWVRIFLIPIKGLDYWLKALYELVSGKDFWFMPACILAEIILFYVFKLSKALCKRCRLKSETGLICFFLVFCAILGFVLDRLNFGDFAMFNRALIAQSFMLIGYLFRKYEKTLVQSRSRNTVIGVLVYLFCGILSVTLLPKQYMDVHLNMYQNIPVCFIMIFSGCFTLFIVSSAIQKVPKMLTLIGQNTLVCYAFHTIGFSVIKKGFSIIGISVPNTWPAAIFLVTLSIVMCVIAGLILNQILPEAVGKKRKTKRIILFLDKMV